MSQHQQSQEATSQEELIKITEERKAAQEQALAEERQWRQMMEASREEEKTNFRDYDQSQVHFVPVKLSSFLEAEHPARVIDLVVERMDLSALYACYSEEGNPPYHPRMMLKVLFYGYNKGLMSCRQVWDALQFRADFIFLSAGQVPNFRTVNAFRLRHLEQLPQLFAQIVFLCVRLGMVGFEHLSVDGQKIQANASFRRSKNLKGLKKEYGKVQQAMQRLVVKIFICRTIAMKTGTRCTSTKALPARAVHPMIVARAATRGPCTSIRESPFETRCGKSSPAMRGGKPT